MKSLLVSDDTTEKASAAMSVRIGGFTFFNLSSCYLFYMNACYMLSTGVTDHSLEINVVYVGSLSDPENLPGLAHFCEHMLFLGTEKVQSASSKVPIPESFKEGRGMKCE